jgi:leucyl aminopeptidase
MALVKVALVHGQPALLSTDLLAVATTTDEFEKGGKLKGERIKALDKALGGVLAEAAQVAEFEGKGGSELTLHTHGKLAAPRLVLLGVGAKAKFEKDAARHAASRAVKAGERAKVKSVSLVLPELSETHLEAAAEGAQLGAYKFDKYLSDKKPRKTGTLELVLDAAATKAQKAAIQLGTELGDTVNLARDLVNEPGGVIYPQTLADAATTVAKEGKLKVQVLGRRQLQALKMEMFLGVAQGSAHEPKMIHLSWEPPAKKGAKKQKPLILVGKAVTFDSGGLSLKPADSMMTMKCDMGGGAAVIAAMRAVALLKPSFPVHGLIGAAENMPSGTAQRPGDVVRARNGKTVEVLNTDAEGRLVLGDVLSYAVEQDPAAIIDLATLTGAIGIALGPYTTGLYATDESLAKEILDGAKLAGEELWRMPLTEHLKELIKSPVADLKNTGGRLGGSITAALFLKEFVGSVPWAHLDIAGPAFIEKDRGYDARGGTGHGVRTLVELIRARMG